jgi:hypothetical protein
MLLTHRASQIIGQLGWKLAASKDVLAIAPGHTAAALNQQYACG